MNRIELEPGLHSLAREDVPRDVDRRRALGEIDPDAQVLEAPEALVRVGIDEPVDGHEDDVPRQVERRREVRRLGRDRLGVIDPAPVVRRLGRRRAAGAEKALGLVHARRYGPPSAENSGVLRPPQSAPIVDAGRSVSRWTTISSGISSRPARGQRAAWAISEPSAVPAGWIGKS